jgi:hypothetical protein
LPGRRPHVTQLGHCERDGHAPVVALKLCLIGTLDRLNAGGPSRLVEHEVNNAAA